MRPVIEADFAKQSQAELRGKLRRAVWGAAIVAAALAPFQLENTFEWEAYLLITAAALLPAFLWVGARSLTLPALPLMGLAYWFYFAVPILTGRAAETVIDPEDLTRAAWTVAAFLVVATAVWAAMLSSKVRRVEPAGEGMAAESIRPIIWTGLSIGLLFNVLVASGQAYVLGETFPIARAIAGGILVVGTFFLGAEWGGCRIGAKERLAAATMLCANILLMWAGLFLVQGIVVLIAFGAGYVSSGRLPLAAILAAALVVSVFHAGKPEMRERYWDEGSNAIELNLGMVPRLFVEWIEEGLYAIGRPESSTVLERTGLLHMLLMVQARTPDEVPYLQGETYVSIPAMLVPRIIHPDKPVTQAGMNLLNIAYGLLTHEGTESTAIGWGLLAEAYANFGYAGVLAVAILLGLALGALSRWCVGAPPRSLRMLFGVMVTISLVNLEGDAATQITSLLQAAIGLAVVVVAIRAWPGREEPARATARRQRRGAN